MGHSVARYIRSLAPLTLLTRSIALHFATLALLARSIHGLAHSLRSLPHGTVAIHESVFTLNSCFTGTIEILVVTRNTPFVAACEVRGLRDKWTGRHFKQPLINIQAAEK